MAPGAERPPSEQGVEYQVLDAVVELARRVDELAQRPAIVAAHANWWDVLPGFGYPGTPGWSEIFCASGRMDWLQLGSCHPSCNAVLRVQQLVDRLELSLQLNGGQILWQRALFFERPPA